LVAASQDAPNSKEDKIGKESGWQETGLERLNKIGVFIWPRSAVSFFFTDLRIRLMKASFSVASVFFLIRLWFTIIVFSYSLRR
jgi:hypothetical protein